MIPTPYLLLLGDEKNKQMVKTATGLAHWRPEHCLGQLRFHKDTVDIGLPDLSICEAVSKGAKTILLGTTPIGGALPASWKEVLLQALANGLNIASGLHIRLAEIPELKAVAATAGQQIYDVRHPRQTIPIGTGNKRSGRRLLTVGTDCGVGKKYTALTLAKEMHKRGLKADFRASGQTGILIAGQGIAVDCIASDFLAGAAELLSPDNDEHHWDIIEGQGSLYNPSYAGVSLGLLHGSQADAIVLCHDASRQMIVGAESFHVPDMQDCIDLNIRLGALTNPNIRCVGLAINTSSLSEQEARAYCAAQEQRLQLPVVDPLRFGVRPIVDKLEREF